jgi:hypothetical protein
MSVCGPLVEDLEESSKPFRAPRSRRLASLGCRGDRRVRIRQANSEARNAIDAMHSMDESLK